MNKHNLLKGLKFNTSLNYHCKHKWLTLVLDHFYLGLIMREWLHKGGGESNNANQASLWYAMQVQTKQKSRKQDITK